MSAFEDIEIVRYWLDVVSHVKWTDNDRGTNATPQPKPLASFDRISPWLEIGAQIEAISKLPRGPLGLGKQVIRIEYYEHDDEVTVSVGRNKSMDDEAISYGASGDLAPALLRALKRVREKLT